MVGARLYGTNEEHEVQARRLLDILVENRE
jgi:hypothetical protein